MFYVGRRTKREGVLPAHQRLWCVGAESRRKGFCFFVVVYMILHRQNLTLHFRDIHTIHDINIEFLYIYIHICICIYTYIIIYILLYIHYTIVYIIYCTYDFRHSRIIYRQLLTILQKQAPQKYRSLVQKSTKKETYILQKRHILDSR